MLTVSELLLLLVTGIFLGLPVWWAWRLVWRYLFRSQDPPLLEDELPVVAVLLPLRGADPSLRHCLNGILNQDYPHYSLHIIIDSDEDPAWELVRATVAQHPETTVKIKVSRLKQRLATCTLKLSAHIQAISELEPSVRVIAFLDADAVPPRNWLRLLVAPFADPRVGGVTGVRWYAPERPTWGALLRHLWNAGSQPQLAAFGLPWGGTMALHARVFREGNLVRHWQRNFADDAGAGERIRQLGLKVRTLPALTMINRESIGLQGCLRFLPRQVLGGRLDLSDWPLILGLNTCALLALVVTVGYSAAGVVSGNLAWLLCFGSVPAFYVVNSMLALAIIERCIRKICRTRDEALPHPMPGWKLIIAALLAEMAQAFTLLAVICARRVQWRGVEYDIDGPRRLRLARYRPFRALPQDGSGADHSIA